MNIQISGSQRSFDLSIPNALILNGLTARIVCSAAAKYAPKAAEKIPPKAMMAIFRELARIKKTHGAWVLVEMESEAGEQIIVTL